MDCSQVVLNMAQDLSLLKNTEQGGPHGNKGGIWNSLIFQYLPFLWYQVHREHYKHLLQPESIQDIDEKIPMSNL